MEVQEKFNSLYIGQDVWVDKDHSNTILTLTGRKLSYTDGYLLLRSVKQLTDEEIIKCGQIGFDFFKCIGCEYKLKVIRELKSISLAAVSLDERTCLVKIEIGNVWKLNIAQIDYLRSIGVLLPFTTLTSGEVKTYSEEEIIQKGWAKTELTKIY